MKKIKLIFSILIIMSNLFSIEVTFNGIQFEYQDGNAQSVFLVGSMNNWNPSVTPMEKDENGVWKVVLKLKPGKHSYKFIVDGNWHFDQENPNFEDDGYGGSNSVIEIDHSGNLITKSNLSTNGIKSTFNPKIYFTGRYFSNNVFLKNETDRFMLDKPEHDLNFGIKIKFNPDFESYTVLNVNNSEEGSEMWKTHFNYERTYLKLNADYFNVTAFDNFGLLTFDDPLHIAGGLGYNEYPFGYDFRGLVLESSNLMSNMINSILPISVNGQYLLSDRIGYNEDDVSAMRMKLQLPKMVGSDLIIGASIYQYTTKTSDEVIQFHHNSEVDLIISKDIIKPGWRDAMQIKISVENSTFENSNEDSVRSVWMEGNNFLLGASLKFPTALTIFANYLNTSLELLESDISRNRYTVGTQFNLKRFVWNLSGKYWENNLPYSLNWADYYKYAEKSDGNGRWYQQFSEVPFEKYTVLGYKSGFMWESDLTYEFEVLGHDLETRLQTKSTHHDVFAKPKFIENIIVIKYDISAKWDFKIDTRIPLYNDPFLGLKTDFEKDVDVFYSNYTEISYNLSNLVWLALGIGVNPKVINSVTDEFYDRGREEYLDTVGRLPEYLESFYGGFGERIREAETSLMKENRITFQAVINF